LRSLSFLNSYMLSLLPTKATSFEFLHKNFTQATEYEGAFRFSTVVFVLIIM